MLIIYNLAIKLYYLAAILISPFNKKAHSFIHGRKNTLKHLNVIAPTLHNCIWFHISSLGEFEQGRPLIEEIKLRFPDEKILVTFFSPSGYEIRKNYELAEYVSYLPIDTAKNAQFFIRTIKPKMAIFVKYDFWHHYLNELHKKSIPTYLISALFRKSQIFFKWYGGFNRKMLTSFNYFYVQNEYSKNLLNKIGFSNIAVSSDTRFDRVAQIAKQCKPSEIMNKFKDNKLIIIAGSTWPEDEKLLLDFINQCKQDVKFIIAPHEIHESHINSIKKQLEKPYITFSTTNPENIADKKVLIIDNIGMLSGLYQYAEIAYIGGGFGTGIHNTLEPATFGLPIIIGPKYRKFKEALDMLENKGAFSIKNKTELQQKLNLLIDNEKERIQSGNSNRSYIENNTGGTKMIINKLFPESV
ncbi:MAG: 3-deoxy-D-manno-octulosonic acid transferase [Bacteroidales bacterium]|nr:3-deoxy-D-manno-octulosonic acid transferase [Bacteroidales bacterium]